MIGDNSGIFFGSSITIADIIMPDGKSLENAGVVPDEVLLPTAEDLAAGRDPVLARAASLCGVDIDSKTAGGYFPVLWK
jgi:C-terminal processing protease CtpA/Prc